MATLDLGDIRLYYEVHGKGPAVVFAHGRGGSHVGWWQQVPSFAKSFTVVTFDHRGFGQSPDAPEGPGRRAYAGDLARLLEHLKIERAALVGQSMGGWTALAFALRHPQRCSALVLADSSAGICEPEILAEYRRRGEPNPNVMERVMAPLFRQANPELAFLYGQLSALNPPQRETLMQLLLSDDGPRRKDLAGFRVPTLLIVGEEDAVVPREIAEMCARCIPGAKLQVFAGAGHSVYYEQPQAFNASVMRFLKEVS